MFSRTAKTTKTVMKATPLKLNPPFSEQKRRKRTRRAQTLKCWKGPRHTKNSTRSEFSTPSEFTTRSDSLLKM